MKFLRHAVFLVVLAAPVAAGAQDATQMALARDMLVAMRAADNFDAVVPTVFQALKPALTQGDAKAGKDWDEIAPTLTSEFSAAKGDLLADIAKVYAQAFTADELKAFVAFYKSPAGEKLSKLTPTLAQQTLLAGQRFGQQVAIRLSERMKDELRKRGNKI